MGFPKRLFPAAAAESQGFIYSLPSGYSEWGGTLRTQGPYNGITFNSDTAYGYSITVAGSSGSNSSYITGTQGYSSGQYYFEVYIESYSNANTIMLGLTDGTTNSWDDAQTRTYYGSNGNKYTNGSGSGYGATYTTGDVISILFNGNVDAIAFYKNGVNQGLAFSNLSGTYYPSFSEAYYTTTCSVRFSDTTT